MSEWQPIETAPKDGTAFLAYGRHDTNFSSRGGTHWYKGDHWWGIVLYDVYREVGMGGARFVFSKDGKRTWSEPTHWMPLPDPPEDT